MNWDSGTEPEVRLNPRFRRQNLGPAQEHRVQPPGHSRKPHSAHICRADAASTGQKVKAGARAHHEKLMALLVSSLTPRQPERSLGNEKCSYHRFPLITFAAGARAEPSPGRKRPCRVWAPLMTLPPLAFGGLPTSRAPRVCSPGGWSARPGLFKCLFYLFLFAILKSTSPEAFL